MKIAVLGAGHGGCAVAAEMALLDHEVSLFDFESFPLNIGAIAEQGGIECSGKLNGFARLLYAGFDIEKTLEGAEVIFVVAPAYSIDIFAKAVKPFIKPEQLVCICPSSCGGAIVFKRGLGVELDSDKHVVSETSTLPYAVRAYEPGKINVYHKLTGGVYFAALPAKKAKNAFHTFQTLYPYAVHANSLLMTMLQTGNNIIHPSITLLNAARIESTNGEFYFYEDGATASVGKLIKALDDEKMQLNKVLDAGLIPDVKVKILQEYNVEESYESGYKTAPGFKGIMAQTQLDHRYFNEDVGYGLVFISELSKQVGLKTPICDALILLVSAIMQRDYRKEGLLTPKTLGIENLCADELKSLFKQK